MKFGIMATYFAPLHTKDYALEYIRIAESLGFDSVWLPEHVVIPAGYTSRYPYAPDGKMPMDDFPFPDPFSLLTFWAAVTDRILLGTGITILPQRNPVILAKQAASIDNLAGGRLRMGIGVGWNREEMEAIGVPWANRGARTDEYVEAMRALWTEDEATYKGDFVAFERCRCLPKPASEGGVPIIVGGHGDAAARRAGRLGDGYWPNTLGGLDRLQEQLRIARAAAEEAGRDFDKVEVMTASMGDPDHVKALAGVGLSRVIFVSLAADLASYRAELERLASSFIGKY